jgi:hypothetical protein
MYIIIIIQIKIIHTLNQQPEGQLQKQHKPILKQIYQLRTIYVRNTFKREN